VSSQIAKRILHPPRYTDVIFGDAMVGAVTTTIVATAELVAWKALPCYSSDARSRACRSGSLPARLPPT
jgi:hypothetical protein